MVLPGMYPDYDEQLRMEEEAKKIQTTQIETTTMYMRENLTKEEMLLALRVVRIQRIEPPPMEVIRVEYPFFYKFMNMFSFGCKISTKFGILILPLSLAFL